MNKKTLQQLIDKHLLKQYINTNEDVSAEEFIMDKKAKILNKHVTNIYPIKKMKKGGRQVYYTKLNPTSREHNRMIYSVCREDLEAKIIAYYIGIELNSKFTVKDILELAISELSSDTAERHEQRFNRYFSSLADIKISRLSEADIRKVLQDMIDRGIKEKEFNNSISTLNKIHDYCVYHHIDCISIRQMISEFRKYKLVGKHVFVTNKKVEKDLAFNESEAVTIIRYSMEHPDYHNLAIAILITTGLRSGELLALKPEDVNLDLQRIKVFKTEKTKTYVIKPYCKDDSERYVYLNEDAMALFHILMDKRTQDQSDCEFLLLNEFADDGKMHLRALDNRIRMLQKILNMSEEREIRSCHDCRRTYASIQYIHGVDIKTIQAQLGHSTPQQTWDYIKDVIDAETRLQTLSKGCILA